LTCPSRFFDFSHYIISYLIQTPASMTGAHVRGGSAGFLNHNPLDLGSIRCFVFGSMTLFWLAGKVRSRLEMTLFWLAGKVRSRLEMTLFWLASKVRSRLEAGAPGFQACAHLSATKRYGCHTDTIRSDRIDHISELKTSTTE
jgi:hypothetical protein